MIGRSNIVGKPMAQLLLTRTAPSPSRIRKTRDLPGEVRRADIVIAAVGRPEMVKGDWLKDGAVVIDVGINRIERDGKGKLVGDVDYASGHAEGRRHHAGAGRRRPDDHRAAAQQHADRRLPPAWREAARLARHNCFSADAPRTILIAAQREHRRDLAGTGSAGLQDVTQVARAFREEGQARDPSPLAMSSAVTASIALRPRAGGLPGVRYTASST